MYVLFLSETYQSVYVYWCRCWTLAQLYFAARRRAARCRPRPHFLWCHEYRLSAVQSCFKKNLISLTLLKTWDIWCFVLGTWRWVATFWRQYARWRKVWSVWSEIKRPFRTQVESWPMTTKFEFSFKLTSSSWETWSDTRFYSYVCVVFDYYFLCFFLLQMNSCGVAKTSLSHYNDLVTLVQQELSLSNSVWSTLCDHNQVNDYLWFLCQL